MKTTEMYFKYLSVACGKHSNRIERPRFIKMNAYAFDQQKEVSDFGEAEVSPGKVRVLLCLCGANNWTENGRSMHEYECDSCGHFVKVYGEIV